MQQVYVKFDSAEQIINFVNIVNKWDVNFDLGEGRVHVNPKSLLGVFSLDCSKPLSLQYDSYNEEIRTKLLPFIYNKEISYPCV